MKKMMFVAAMAAMVLSSCSKEETVNDATTTRGAIGFESFVGKPTKGVPVAGNEFTTGAKMKIYGYTSDAQLGTDFSATTVIENLDGATANFDGTSWSYSPTAYWVDTKFHSFFAVSPETIPVASGVATVTVADAVADQADLMVTDPVKQSSAYAKANGTAAAVNFTMRHVLSQVLFQAKIAVTDATVTNVKINSITIEQKSSATFFNQGTVSIIGKTDANAYAVTGQTGTVTNYVITPTGGVAVDAANYKDVKHGTADVAMLLPQSVSAFVVKANVTHTLQTGGEQAPMDITFDAGAIEWKPNMKYAYKLNIDVPVQILKKEPIKIGSVDIVDWADASPAPVDPTPQP